MALGKKRLSGGKNCCATRTAPKRRLPLLGIHNCRSLPSRDQCAVGFYWVPDRCSSTQNLSARVRVIFKMYASQTRYDWRYVIGAKFRRRFAIALSRHLS